jgi:hypothetical protein
MNDANPTDASEGRQNAMAIEAQLAFASGESAGSPQLVKKGRITVIRGKFPEAFDWDAFLEEEQNQRLCHTTGFSDQQKT